MDPVLQTRGLRYRYPDGTLALDGLDFCLYPQETVAVLGPNGSGKSTFTLMLNGLLEGEGEIVVQGVRLEKKTRERIRQTVGLVFQNADLQLFMPTVLEDVAFGPRNIGLAVSEAMQAAREALRQVGLDAAAHKAPYLLSAGEKRRAAIAGVLAMQPGILVLDEPTTALDPPGQRELVALLAALPQAKIVITHDTFFASKVASRAVFLERGKITAHGTVEEVVRCFRWDESASLD